MLAVLDECYPAWLPGFGRSDQRILWSAEHLLGKSVSPWPCRAGAWHSATLGSRSSPLSPLQIILETSGRRVQSIIEVTQSPFYGRDHHFYRERQILHGHD